MATQTTPYSASTIQSRVSSRMAPVDAVSEAWRQARSFARARAARALAQDDNAGRLGGKKVMVDMGSDSGRGLVLLIFMSQSERACHPERRRREGPAFGAARGRW